MIFPFSILGGVYSDCRIAGNRISCLLRPIGNQAAGSFQDAGVFRISRQIDQLIGILAQIEKFLFRARIGENLLLGCCGLTSSMSLPML